MLDYISVNTFWSILFIIHALFAVALLALMAEGGILKPPLPSPEQFIDLRYLQAAGIQ